ncbi:DNA polymerase I [Thermodesulfobacteriota bacterium]
MVQERETVYLVDGSSYIYRAYHAIRNLSNSKGFPTNAVLGFTKMILKLYEEKQPRYLAIALDMKAPTFRHKLYKHYKATRPPMPDDLVAQLPYIKAVVRALNIKLIEMEGYEADDIMGTLARKGEEKDFDVVMVTGDKDFRQLISPHVSMWDTMKNRYVDYEAFKKEYELEPAQIIDMMGLSGDNSDNIPGVPGVGEKTALGLIKEFGSIDGVYKNLDSISRKKLKENLSKSHEDALLSKELVTIIKDVPLNDDIDDLEVGEPLNEELSRLFRELEFRGLWEQYASRREQVKKDYRLCISEEDVLDLAGQIKREGIVSIDTETTSNDPLQAKLVGISFSFEEDKAYYLPVGHTYQGVPDQLSLARALDILNPVIENEEIVKIGQNIKYDAIVLRRHGAELKGIHFDTMIASYVINPGLRQHNLDYLAQHYLNHKMVSYHEVVGRGKTEINFSEVDVGRARDYSCEDADITLKLRSILDDQLRKDRNQKLFHDLEMKLLPVLMDMELAGIKINIPFFREMSALFTIKVRDIQEKIYKEAGMKFNINSSQQLGFVLFEKLQLPVQKKTAKTKAYSTDVKVLKTLAQAGFIIPQHILRYRTLSKLKSTYLDALVRIVNPSTGRIHSSFNQTVTATGRLSSSNPNLQNIPVRGDEGREIRKGFVADDGCYLLSADYSQIELRLFAHYSGDEAFMEAFRREEDIHSRTASEILGAPISEVTSDMRRIAKAINFGIIYGMGARKLSDELGIENKTAKEYIESYYKRYTGVKRYKEEIVEKARKDGFVTTLFNRRRYLPEINSDRPRIRGEAERMAVNTPIQGTAADLIKQAMINIHSRLKQGNFQTRMLLQVHDELVFEVPEHEIEKIKSIVKKEMEDVYKLDVPLKVDMDYGRNWDEAH